MVPSVSEARGRLSLLCAVKCSLAASGTGGRNSMLSSASAYRLCTCALLRRSTSALVAGQGFLNLFELCLAKTGNVTDELNTRCSNIV
jgi:hypothetical protein